MAEGMERGLAMRRRVMGEQFVAQAYAGAGEFARPLQDFISEHAWGSVWCRGGLDLRTRSLVTVAMLTALGRREELAGHLRGAVNNGASQEEIREVLLQAAVYCGVPLAAEAFRCAAAVFAEGRREEGGER